MLCFVVTVVVLFGIFPNCRRVVGAVVLVFVFVIDVLGFVVTVVVLCGIFPCCRRWCCYLSSRPIIFSLKRFICSSFPQIIAFTSLLLILTSVTTFCLETLPFFSDEKTVQNKALYVLESVCVAWFTLEFFLRLVFCPNKLAFAKQPMNWIDLGAVLPFYLELFLTGSNIKTIVVLRVVRLIRVFRIFKLSRHSYGLQILGHTLKSSFSELFLLAFFLSIGVVIFSSVIYYAEKDVNDTKFKTIPHSFWWAVVTMTTLGYGDMVPKTPWGQLVGSLCAVCGVLMIALPVPVIVSNFSLYYSHAKAKLNLPKRKKQLIIGAANALRIAEPFGGSQASGNMELNSQDSHSASSSQSSHAADCANSGAFRPLSILTSAVAAPPSPSPPRASPCTQSPRDGRRGTTFVGMETQNAGIEMEEIRVEKQPLAPPEQTSEACPSLAAAEARGGGFGVVPVINHPSLSSKSSSRDSGSDARSSRRDRRRSQSGSKSVSIESSQGSPKQSRGRRGRRGSLYVVGFTAKHWQNKALKYRNRSESSPVANSANLSVSPETRSLSCPQPGCRDDSLDWHDTQSCGVPGNSPVPDHRNEAVDEAGRNASIGTQTGKGVRKTQVPKSSRRHRGETFSNTKGLQTSLSVDSNDSSGRMSDDSLFVHEILRQRRGSSPLIRQKAIFTFDPDASANDATGAKNEGNSKASDAHLAPAIEINGSNAAQMDQSRGRRNSCIPAISYTPNRNGSRPRSNPEVSGFVNGSFDGDESLAPSQAEPAIRTAEVKSNVVRDETLKEKSESGRQRTESSPRQPPVYQDCADSHLPGEVSPASDTSQRSFLSPESPLPSITEEIDAKSEAAARHLTVAAALSRMRSVPTASPAPVRPVVNRRPYSDSAFTERRGSISPELYISGFVGSPSWRGSPDSSRSSPKSLASGSPVSELAQRRQGKMLYVQLPLTDVEAVGSGGNRDYRRASSDPNRELHDRESGRRDMATSPFVFQNPGFFSSPDSLNTAGPEGAFFSDQSNIKTPNRSSPDFFLPRTMPGSPRNVPGSPRNVPASHRNVSGSPRNVPGSPRNVSGSFNSFPHSPSQNKSTNATPQTSPSSNQESGNYSPRTPQDRYSYRSTGASETAASGDRHTPPNIVETSLGFNRAGDESPRRPRSPFVQTEGEVVPNGYMSGNYRRPPSATSDTRQRARAMFFGDSGISSVGSGSTTSISHSVEYDVDPRERRESVSSGTRAEVLNPIHESDKESTSSGSFRRNLSRESSTRNSVSVSLDQPGNRANETEVYETSLV